MHSDYIYTHAQTEATTGYYSCEPAEKPSLETALTQLSATPYDGFLYSYCLRILCTLPTDELHNFFSNQKGKEPRIQPGVIAALLAECTILRNDCNDFLSFLPPFSDLADHSPLIYIRWAQLSDRQQHTAWSQLFSSNICDHRALPHPDDVEETVGFSFPYTIEELCTSAQHDVALSTIFPPNMRTASMAKAAPSLRDIHETMRSRESTEKWQRRPSRETAMHALDVLLENGIISAPEMRHQASLSPIALLRHWDLDISVKNANFDYTLKGQATAWGKGLSLADARASYSMEIVERASVYVSIDDTGSGTEENGLYVAGTVTQRQKNMRLYRAKYSDFAAKGLNALNPNELCLEVPYNDAPLHWVKGETPEGSDIYMPAQCVFLFCNLDEQEIVAAPISTGIASGNTTDEARLTALLEIVERDAQATCIFSRANCFRLQSRDKLVQSLLDDYAARGIQIQFRDITPASGVPCYECFVMHPKGQIARATAAKLDGAAAVLSALTETPYPYPYGEPSGPALKNLPIRVLEDLPSYHLGSATQEKIMLETLFSGYGQAVCYADITRDDLAIPVVRAMVTRTEQTADRDRYSRISKAMGAHYFAATSK